MKRVDACTSYSQKIRVEMPNGQMFNLPVFRMKMFEMTNQRYF
jgi:hypothetical protein